MDKKYIELFKELAKTTAITSEKVMDYDHEKGDTQGMETATILRNNFLNLEERIETSGENYSLTKNDAAELAIGAIILVSQLENQINNLKHVMTEYQTNIIPILKEIVDKAADDTEAGQMANEKFIIKNNE